MAVTGRELGIIVGLGLAALCLVVLALLLVAIGTFLFLGEWLFGSMAWGILHGTLFLALLIVPIAVDLAGGPVGAWGRGVLVGLVATFVLWLVLASNVLRDSAVHAGHSLEASLAIEPAALPTLVGLVAGALVLGVVLALAGSRQRMGIRLGVVGLVLGAILGAILGSFGFSTSGALAVALTIGLVVAIAMTGVFAMRQGLDPERRYERLVPRETIAMAEETKRFLERQWRRQRRKVMGR